MTATAIIAITPQDFFIIVRLALTVLKVSLTEAPTKGTKLLIANLVVFKEIESALWESVLLYDSTNIKSDITNTVTDVNVVLTVFEIPLTSQQLFKHLTHPNAKHILISGSINESKKVSTTLMNNMKELFITTALDIFPLIVSVLIIIGIKLFITLHKSFIYAAVFDAKALQTFKTVIEIQRAEQMEKILLALVSDKELLRILNIEIMIIKAKIEANSFKTVFIPEVKYDSVSSKKDFSLISPFINCEKSPSNNSLGKKSCTYSGSESLK